jgi:hypothetical protein
MATRATTAADPRRTTVPAAQASSGRRPPGYRRGVLLGLAGLVLVSGIAFLAIAQVPKKAAVKDDSRAATAKLTPAPIDGARAYGYLKQICDLGPRPAGTEANERQRKMVSDHFKKTGAVVREQPFVAPDPLSGQAVRMTNLIGSWFPDRTQRIVIGAHYDTRPFPDRELDPVERQQPFLGANDCASGVALLMELAHHMNDSPTPWGVDLVLFDGEELVYDRVGEYFLGSKEFARQYKADRRSKAITFTYVAGFVLDMIGGRDLHLPKEPYSIQFAGRLTREVWTVAKRLGARAFTDTRGTEVLDDHLPLNDAGIPTTDIIDFSYAHWHRASDLPENCSAESLAQVGRVLSAWLAMPEQNAKK